MNHGQVSNVTCKATGGPRPNPPVVWTDVGIPSLLETFEEGDTVGRVYHIPSLSSNTDLWCTATNNLSGNRTIKINQSVWGVSFEGSFNIE